MATAATGPTGSELYCSECGRRYPAEDLARFGANVVCIECKPRFVQRMSEGTPALSVVQYGGFWRRVGAAIIDSLILAAVNTPISMLLGGTIVVRPSANAQLGIMLGVSYLLDMSISLAYYAYFLSQKSATPGKMLLGMKVITATGGRISVGRAVARYFAQFVSGIVLGIGYIMVAFDSEKRALHDYICGTRVVRV